MHSPTHSVPDILAMADDDTFALSAPSTLNPEAPAFVPSYLVNEAEARRIDDICQTVHHFASVHESETLMQAQMWMNGDGQYDEIDAATGYLCSIEDGLRAHLYAPPRRAKGNTYGRKRR
jgi:hypothetical protein